MYLVIYQFIIPGTVEAAELSINISIALFKVFTLLKFKAIDHEILNFIPPI